MNNHHRPQTPLPGPDCESFAPLLALVGQERLAARDASDLRNHLATCAYCQQELETYNWLDDALARHYGPVPRGPLSLSDVRAITSRDYQPRTPPPEPLAAPEAPREQRLSRPERPSHMEPPRPPERQQRPQRGRRLISLLSAVAAVLIIAAVSLALFASHPGKPGNIGPTPENKYIPQQQDVLSSISMLSASEGWAVGATSVSEGVYQNLILHYKNGQWNRVSSLTNKDLQVKNSWLTQVFMVSTSEGWAIGNAQVNTQTNSQTPVGFILHYTGGRWVRQMTAPLDTALTGIAMTSATNGWAIGTLDADNGAAGGASLLLHYNGTAWTQVPGSAGVGLLSITMTSASNGWIIAAPTGNGGFGEANLLLQYDGNKWTQIAAPSIFDQLFALSFTSASDGWAVGIKYLDSPNGAKARYSGAPFKIIFAHFNGKTWGDIQTPITYDQSGSASITSLFMDSSSDGWAIGAGSFGNTSGTIYLHYSSGKWALVNGPDVEELNAIFMLSASEGWAVGRGGTIMHYVNGVWNQAAGVPTPTPMPPTPTPTNIPGAPCTSHSGPTGASSTPGATVPPGPVASWSTYTNTTYHFTLKYPANWGLDNLNCPDSAYLAFWNYNYIGWQGPGFPPGGIKIELYALENPNGLSAMQFFQMEEQNEQQNPVDGPACSAYTTRALQVDGRDAVEATCSSLGHDMFYIPDGSVMLRMVEYSAPDGDPSYTTLKQMVNSMLFTN